MSMQERLRAMAVIKHFDDEAGYNKENVPLMLALQGVPERALEKITAHLDADRDNANTEGGYGATSNRLRRSVGVAKS